MENKLDRPTVAKVLEELGIEFKVSIPYFDFKNGWSLAPGSGVSGQGRHWFLWNYKTNEKKGLPGTDKMAHTIPELKKLLKSVMPELDVKESKASYLISLVESGYDPSKLIEKLSPEIEIYGADRATPNSPASKMLNDVKKEYESNPEYVKNLVLDLTYNSDTEVELTFIHTLERSSGLGGRALKMLTDIADRYKVALTGQVHNNPKVFGRKTLPKDKLTAWYLRHGFMMKGKSKDKVVRSYQV